ncbi:MAG: dTMP kinase [Nocardiopsis sp. BM-2018]|uniref:Thymidylate kinase n=1 Tax=Nocardiopsis metallicus TaxID=179819 RepID=A0A840WC57_9ACTN|nr:dTMP kinase [Nocardiopsis metallicus]MBB5494579.1 dTMP kinase [Nocardiopsis metallicus]QRN81474.1 MAG: dTMP kinase [Nocardiopsis sp. BM-2018]
MSRSAPLGAPAEAQNVLAITPFRRLWISLSLSSLGDWLSLLALVSLAAIFTAESSTLVHYLAVTGVVAIKLAPAVLLSPLVGSLADRLDRRWTMVGGDVLRGLLYVSIPVVGLLSSGFALRWLLIASLLAEIVALLWTPARDATIPSLVPKRMLGQANKLTLLATYGAAPVAALLFAALASVSNLLGALVPSMANPEADVALYLNALTFFGAAIVVASLPLPKHAVSKGSLSPNRDANTIHAVLAGRTAVGSGPLVRGVVTGLAVTAAAGGLVLGVGRPHVENLGAGNAGFGVLVAALFLGLGLGAVSGPRVLKQFSRRRLLGLAVVLAALALLFTGAISDMVLSAVLALVLGLGAGLTWVSGTGLISVEVEEEQRDSAFALLHGTGRLALLLGAVLAPLAAGFAGDHEIPLGGPLAYDLYGSGLVLMAGGLIAVIAAVVAYRQANLDDPEAGPGLLPELFAALRGVTPKAEEEEEARLTGAFIVLEGGEGAGKSTQVRELTVWLRDQGFEVVGTRQPGATKLGMRLRGILLDRENSHITDRAEVLLYAADKADHVEQEILPALRRGAVVISDRYVDSLLAYQGAGRDLAVEEVGEISAWATQGLVPDLTVLLDVRPEDGLSRLGGPADRIESESVEFHARVRKGFRSLAEANPDRYLVLDAREPQEKITREIQRRLRPLLPDPIDSSSEAVTGMIPVIRPEQEA